MKTLPLDTLRDMLAERPPLQDAILRTENALAKDQAAEAALLADPNALDDEDTIAKLTRLRTRIELAPAKLNYLRGELAAFDARLVQQAQETADGIWRSCTELDKSRYEKFCEALAPFFDGGRDAKFFRQQQGSIGIDIPSLQTFRRSDASAELERLRRMIPPRDSGLSPVARAEKVLALGERIPAE